MSAPALLIYTRRGCGLCVEMEDVVERLAREAGVAVETRDVDEDPELARLFSEEVPVLFVDGRKFAKYRVSERDLRRKLRRNRTPGR
jgi:glutaredoxin